MINKKTIPVALLLLVLVAAAIVAGGANQGTSYNVAPGTVVKVPGTGQDQAAPAEAPAAPDLAPAVGQVAFSDSFSSGSLNGWHLLPGSTGVWAVPGRGTLEQLGASEDGELSNDDSVLVSDFNAFSDGTFEAQVFPSSGEHVGVVFLGSDAGYYQLWLNSNAPSDAPKARLQKVVGGRTTDIAVNTTWKGYATAQWQTVSVTAAGGRITASVGGEKLFDTTDTSFSSGWVGVLAVADRGAEFDNVRVQRGVAGR